MPVEIRELVIKAVVTEACGDSETSLASDATGEDREAIIAACVKQVIKILQQSRDR